jgi:cellulose synthase/poly-beta-1,6-N-acetylglucosamine synthase-like glycosyltransferase
MSSPVILSLVVATVDRTDELALLLRSVDSQSMDELEVVVVDQNPDERVRDLLSSVSCRCVHVRSARGLSRARNAGLEAATGAIVGFPDDDCWYPAGLLRRVKQWFEDHPADDFLCCGLQDATGREVAARWPARSGPIDRISALRAAVSSVLFLRTDAIRAVGGFDESIGLGAESAIQSGEDTDLVLRCLAAGSRGWFEKEFHVCHPRRDPSLVPAQRGFSYGMGFGYILGKHGYSAWLPAYHVGRALGGGLQALLRLRIPEAAFYFQSARGRALGYTIGHSQDSADRSRLPAGKVLG